MPSTRSRQLSAFMQGSLDGYFCDARGDIAFAHQPPDDGEWQEFAAGNATDGRPLIFGRRTYDMMAAWWPTPGGRKGVAGGRCADECAAENRLFADAAVG